ncbi:hypothetical protein V490_08259 [Pseudogymnoascus sp. VKM F-3557]|nr:hypothetical protein V490_08259 [Pseudogymnoascus sp. VKM F-3557]
MRDYQPNHHYLEQISLLYVVRGTVCTRPFSPYQTTIVALLERCPHQNNFTVKHTARYFYLPSPCNLKRHFHNSVPQAVAAASSNCNTFTSSASKNSSQNPKNSTSLAFTSSPLPPPTRNACNRGMPPPPH